MSRVHVYQYLNDGIKLVNKVDNFTKILIMPGRKRKLFRTHIHIHVCRYKTIHNNGFQS